MANDTSKELRALVRRDRDERVGPFDPELRERLIAYAKRRWAEGATMQDVADELGVSGHTVSYWRAQRREMPALRRVQIISERPLDVERRVTLRGPAGTAIDGLSFDEVAELWMKLA